MSMTALMLMHILLRLMLLMKSKSLTLKSLIIMFKRYNERCSEPAKNYAKSVVSSYRVIDTSRQMSDGVLTKSSNVKVIDPEQLFAGTSALDLSLENLIAIGADLRPQVARMSELQHAINADRQVEKAEIFMSNLEKSE